MPETTTRSFVLRVLKVMFADGSVWSSDENTFFEAIPSFDNDYSLEQVEQLRLDAKRPVFREPLNKGALFRSSLGEHLAQVDRDARERMEMLVQRMAEAEGVDEKMKAENQMGWVGAMNGIAEQSREIVLTELIYT